MRNKNVILGISSLMFALFVPVMSSNAQILNQDLEKEYDQEKKKLSAQPQVQSQNTTPAPAATAANDGDGIEIGGPPPRENFSSLSQQDAGIILEAAKSLEVENPELAKKLLDIGK